MKQPKTLNRKLLIITRGRFFLQPQVAQAFVFSSTWRIRLPNKAAIQLTFGRYPSDFKCLPFRQDHFNLVQQFTKGNKLYTSNPQQLCPASQPEFVPR
jgi:hypothetical protein